SELWDLNLVDPDNRRHVDWHLRQTTMEELARAADTAPDRAAFAHDLVKRKGDGRVKLYLIRQALACRAAHAGLFATGEDRPLAIVGKLAGQVLVITIEQERV